MLGEDTIMLLLMFSLSLFYGGLWTATDRKGGMILKPSHRKLFLAQFTSNKIFQCPNANLLNFTKIITCLLPATHQHKTLSLLFCQKDVSNFPLIGYILLKTKMNDKKQLWLVRSQIPFFNILGKAYLLMNES